MKNRNKTRSRKAKATVRTTKPRTTEQVTRDINHRKIKAAFQSKAWNTDPQFRVDFSFTLTQDQDMNDPIEFLYDQMGERLVDRLNTGSGYCMMTGSRDFGFEGSKDEIARVMKAISGSPYRIHRLTVAMLESEDVRTF